VAALPDFDCYVADLPAFGESGPLQGEHSVENYSRWLEGFIKALKLNKSAAVLGHSFGTLVVGHYAISNSYHRIILVNPVSEPAMQGPRTIMTKLSRFYYRFSASRSPRFGRWLLALPPVVWLVTAVMFKSDDANLRRWVEGQHSTYFSRFTSAKTAAEGFEASIAHDLTEYAPSIRQKTLLICADQDDVTSIQAQRAAAELYSDATYVELTGVGHLTHYERPIEIAHHARDFLVATR
jgi:pimeloyl-ACP methyl ester carboxylesterase